jgi:hypothetical protein
MFDHLIKLEHLRGSSKHHRSAKNLLWLACAWVI